MTGGARGLAVGLLALAAVLATPRPVAHAQASQDATSAGVSAATQAWTEAFNSRDPKRIVALYATDAVFWGTTAKAIATTPEALKTLLLARKPQYPSGH